MGKKEEILNVAYILFSEKGYSLSLSELSRAVKIKTPSLYSHFKSKEEIIECIVKKEIEDCFCSLEKIIISLEGKSCKEKFECILFSIFDYFKQNGRLAFWRHIALMQNDRLRKQFQTLIQEKEDFYLDKLKKCVKDAIKNGEIKESVGEGAVNLYFVMIQGMLDALLLYENRCFDANDYLKKTWGAFWQGIKVNDEEVPNLMIPENGKGDFRLLI